jgi:hypothetical protein
MPKVELVNVSEEIRNHPPSRFPKVRHHLVCANCGEEYVGEATTAHLLRTAKEVSRAGVEADVREYVGP